jgi:hypothetical protein
MTERPHHILVILAVGLAFEGLLISAASGFTLGTPFVNAIAAGALLVCGAICATERRVRVFGVIGYLLGLAITAVAGLNIARLGLKWQATWGWTSIPAIHSAIGAGACLFAVVALWRRWPTDRERRRHAPALRAVSVTVAAGLVISAWIVLKAAAPPRTAAADRPTQAVTRGREATPGTHLVNARPSNSRLFTPFVDPGPVVILGPGSPSKNDVAERNIEYPVGPVVILNRRSDAPASTREKPAARLGAEPGGGPWRGPLDIIAATARPLPTWEPATRDARVVNGVFASDSWSPQLPTTVALRSLASDRVDERVRGLLTDTTVQRRVAPPHRLDGSRSSTARPARSVISPDARPF